MLLMKFVILSITQRGEPEKKYKYKNYSNSWV